MPVTRFMDGTTGDGVETLGLMVKPKPKEVAIAKTMSVVFFIC